MDFSAGTDIIGIDSGAFGYTTGQSVTLKSGTSATGKAAIGGTATNAFVYLTETGALWFDANWSNAGNAIELATLTGAPTLTAASFKVTLSL